MKIQVVTQRTSKTPLKADTYFVLKANMRWLAKDMSSVRKTFESKPSVSIEEGILDLQEKLLAFAKGRYAGEFRTFIWEE